MPVMEMNQIPKEANVFVKNIDKNLSSYDLLKEFQNMGEVIVLDLRTNEMGESLGYGCVQYKTIQEANNCVQ